MRLEMKLQHVYGLSAPLQDLLLLQKCVNRNDERVLKRFSTSREGEYNHELQLLKLLNGMMPAGRSGNRAYRILGAHPAVAR